jgi:phosphoribosyl-ATP pyrophosphohydrolase
MKEAAVLGEVWDVIGDRIARPDPQSYVSRLMTDPKGIDRVLEKVGEEATEFILAVKNRDRASIISEAADLQFHLLVALQAAGIDLSEVFHELEARRR